MKYINIIAASLGFALTCGHSDQLMAATGALPITLNLDDINGLVLKTYTSIPDNDSRLTRKMVTLSGNRSSTGKSTHRSNNHPFIAPGINSGFLQATNHFGQQGERGHATHIENSDRETLLK